MVNIPHNIHLSKTKFYEKESIATSGSSGGAVYIVWEGFISETLFVDELISFHSSRPRLLCSCLTGLKFTMY